MTNNHRQSFAKQDIGYLLTAYADGQLAPDGVMWVEEQLDGNGDLRAKLKEIRQLQAGLRAAFAGGAPVFALDLPRREAVLASAANPPPKRINFMPAIRIALVASALIMVVAAISTPNLLESRASSERHRDLVRGGHALHLYDLDDSRSAESYPVPQTKPVDPTGFAGDGLAVTAGRPANGAYAGLPSAGLPADAPLLAKVDDELRDAQKDANEKESFYRLTEKEQPARGGRVREKGQIMEQREAQDNLARADRAAREPSAKSEIADAKQVQSGRSAANKPASVLRERGAVAAAPSATTTPAAPATPPRPVVVQPAKPKLEVAKKANAESDGSSVRRETAQLQEAAKRKFAPPGAPAPAQAETKTQTIVTGAPVEPTVADEQEKPLALIEIPLEEKLVSEDANSAEGAKGREEAVATSETGSTGPFLAVGADGGTSFPKSEAEKELANLRRARHVYLRQQQGVDTPAQPTQDLEKRILEAEKRVLEERLELARQSNNEKSHIAQVEKAVAFQLNVKLAEVEDDYNNSDTALAQRQEELAKARQNNDGKERKLAILKDRYPKIAAEIADEKQTASFVQGVVGAVRNNPQGEQELLMLTLGKDETVEAGAEFIVYRQNRYIVRVKTVKTMEGMVACRVVPGSWNANGLQIQNGDLAQTLLGDEVQAVAFAARSLLISSSAVDPRRSLAALQGAVTVDASHTLAEALRLIGGDKVGFSLTSGAESALDRQVQVRLHDESAARGILRAARIANLQAQFAGGLVQLDTATRPLDPADTQGYDLPTFKNLFGTAPMQAIAVDPVQTVAIDADTASYSYAKARVAAGQPVDPATIKPEHFINAMPMGYPAAAGPEAFSLYAEAAPSPFARANTAWGARTALVTVGAVAKPAAADERKPLALTLAIDCSGSMAQPGGLERIQRGLLAFVEHLRAEDRVSLVSFGDQARVILPATPGNDRAALANALMNLATGGATNCAEGLSLAYQLAAETTAPGVESRVLLATDGGTVAGADDLLRRVTAYKDRGITLVVVGTGKTYHAGPLQELATKGDGQHYYVGSDEDAQNLFTGKLLPDRIAVLAKDAKLQVTWNPQRVSHARLVGYDQRRLAAKDFRNNAVDAGELSQDTQVTALFEVLLVDGGTGPLGNAAVRYFDTRRGDVRELVCPLPGSILASQPSDRLRLVACAAATAEWLQRGWWSNVYLITPEEIRAQLARCPQPIAAELRAMVK